MKKLKQFFTTLLAALLFSGFSYGQAKTNRVPIAIVDFIPAKGLSNEASSVATAVQELLTNEFSNRTDEFKILDRSAMSAILKEVETEHGEEFINSPNLISEGRLTGAKFIATGIITLYNKTAAVGNTAATAQISVSLKIIDLETGESRTSQVINEGSSFGGGDPTSSALSKIKTDLNNLILRVFPPVIKIIQLVQVDDVKGRLEKVMLNKGEETFSFTEEKNLIGMKEHKSPKLVVIRRETINNGSDNLINDVTIGELALDKLQGQVSVWNVVAKDHGKAILDLYRSGATDKLVIKPE